MIKIVRPMRYVIQLKPAFSFPTLLTLRGGGQNDRKQNCYTSNTWQTIPFIITKARALLDVALMVGLEKWIKFQGAVLFVVDFVFESERYCLCNVCVLFAWIKFGTYIVISYSNVILW